MILYSKRLGGLPLLFRITGTAWPYGILPALVSVAIGTLLGVFDKVDDALSDKSKFMQHPYPFQLYAFIIGFLIVFRTNFAYQRYWEGRSTLAQMASKWLDGACMAVTFDAPGDVTMPLLEGIGDSSTVKTSKSPTKNGAVSHEEFVAEILHLFSLMHALALMHLRGDTNLDNLIGFSMLQNGQAMQTAISLIESGPSYRSILASLPDPPKHSIQNPRLMRLTTRSMLHAKFDDVYKEQRLAIIGSLRDEERRALDKDGQGNFIPTEARVTMVEGWIFRRLIARQKHEECDMGITSAPILSRLYQVISDGCLGFGQAAKIADTPFPFPYQNLLQLFLWVYVLVVPFVMNAWLRDPFLRGTLTFLSVWCYFALNQVGNNLEDPYIPYDPNEIPLMHIQHSFNAKLLSYGAVPEPECEEVAVKMEMSCCDSPVRGRSGNGSVSISSSPLQSPLGRDLSSFSGETECLAASPQKDLEDPLGGRHVLSGSSSGAPQRASPSRAGALEAKLAAGRASPAAAGGGRCPPAEVDRGPRASLLPAGDSGIAVHGGGATDPRFTGVRRSRAEDKDAGFWEITPIFAGSLRELAAVHSKCLHIVGALEGALSRHQDGGVYDTGEVARDFRSMEL